MQTRGYAEADKDADTIRISTENNMYPLLWWWWRGGGGHNYIEISLVVSDKKIFKIFCIAI